MVHRIDNSTAVAVLPVAAPAGPPGFWTKGDTTVSPILFPTDMDQDFANMVQEELIAIGVGTGQVPTKGIFNQLWTGLLGFFVPRTVLVTATTWQALNASATITVPAGFGRIEVRAVGGGGGGSNCNTQSENGDASGGGGGVGGHVEGIYLVTAGSELTAVIGGGGAAQSKGGDTSLSVGQDVLFTAPGGTGSSFQSNGSSAGGIGGTPTGSAGTLVLARGQDGSDGQATVGSLTFWFAGNGGSGPWGGGGRAANGGGSGANAPGAGGGGAYDLTLSGQTKFGGTGGNGLILYRWLTA